MKLKKGKKENISVCYGIDSWARKIKKKKYTNSKHWFIQQGVWKSVILIG